LLKITLTIDSRCPRGIAIAAATASASPPRYLATTSRYEIARARSSDTGSFCTRVTAPKCRHTAAHHVRIRPEEKFMN